MKQMMAHMRTVDLYTIYWSVARQVIVRVKSGINDKVWMSDRVVTAAPADIRIMVRDLIGIGR